VAALPHDDASVDLVISIASAHHWADVDAGLRELRRVLRPGAQAMIYDVRPVVRAAVSSARGMGMRASAQPLGLGFARLVLRR
jgi:ubiquinone/menaquinone biosynthesis C-methylase UbiE